MTLEQLVAPSVGFRPITVNDFSFHGFDDLMMAVEETLEDIGIRSGPLATSVVEDAIFVPTTRVALADPSPRRTFTTEGLISSDGEPADPSLRRKFVTGGLVTRDGQPIDFAQARRRTSRFGPLVRGEVFEGMREQAAVKASRVVDEEVVYLGWLMEHFGHFLSESFTRAWFLKEVDPSVKVVYHKKDDFTLSPMARRILEAFGIPMDRILFLDETTLLRRAIVPEPLHELHWSTHEQLPQMFREVAARIVSGGEKSDQPVYLSRRFLSSRSRQIVGEFELEEILRENGFHIAHPETMSFEDQVRLFNRHADIFTSDGSAAYNVLFALNRPTMHFLTSDIPRQDYFMLPAVCESPAGYCNCLSRGGRPFHKATPRLAESLKLVDYLETRGFLRKRLRASLMPQDSRLQERFDEEWFFVAVRMTGPGGQAFPPESEDEVMLRARSSWPLSLMLAKYYSARDVARTDRLVRQFADLASMEPDISRLATYRSDVENAVKGILKHCRDLDLQTATRLSTVLADRFQIDVSHVAPEQDLPARSNAAVGGWNLRDPEFAAGSLPLALSKWTDNPIVIGATDDSGSRVLAQILQRAGVFIGSDLDQALDSEALTIFFDLWTNLFAARDNVLGLIEERSLETPMIRSLVAALADHWGDAEASGQPWGWKADRSIFLLPFFYRQFPALRFIHLVRDGRDIAYSETQTQLNKHGPTYLGRAEQLQSQPAQAITLWNRVNLAAAEYGEQELGDRYLRIRFEDLCTAPVATVGRLLDFAGSGASAQELATLVQPPPTLGRWREQDEVQRKELHRIGREALRKFGYSGKGRDERPGPS
jgi:hypothetical protein